MELSVSNLLFDKTSRNKEILIRRLTDLSLADLITMHCTKPPGGISAIMYSTHSHSQIVNYDSLVRDLKLKVGRYFQYLSLQHSPQSSEAQRLLAMFVRSTSCWLMLWHINIVIINTSWLGLGTNIQSHLWLNLQSVLWSGESKFEIFGSTCRVFVRHRKGERMVSTCMVFTMKRGGGCVMVWGCFAGDTVGDLFKTEGTLNQHGYRSILQQYAILSSLRLVGPSFIFQQDSDPRHTSRLCRGYLTKKESDGVLRQMTWPPQSPDLNPIEMVWDEMDCRVKAKGPTSARHRWELLQDWWKTKFQVTT